MKRRGDAELWVIGIVLTVCGLLIVDLLTFHNDGDPVPGVVAGQGYVPAQTHIGTAVGPNGQVMTTVSSTGPDYSVIVQLPDRRVVVDVSRAVWEVVKDGDRVAVQFQRTDLFGFTGRRLVTGTNWVRRNGDDGGQVQPSR